MKNATYFLPVCAVLVVLIAVTPRSNMSANSDTRYVRYLGTPSVWSTSNWQYHRMYLSDNDTARPLASREVQVIVPYGSELSTSGRIEVTSIKDPRYRNLYTLYAKGHIQGDFVELAQVKSFSSDEVQLEPSTQKNLHMRYAYVETVKTNVKKLVITTEPVDIGSYVVIALCLDCFDTEQWFVKDADNNMVPKAFWLR